MRNSRIPHPPGGRHVKVWRWAVDAVGKAAATVLGELEWRDRLEEEPGLPVATRAELIAALEGFVGRNAVDEAVEELVKIGWIRRHERRTLGEKNLRTWVEFSLDAEIITKFLAGAGAEPGGNREEPGSPGSRNREARDPDSGAETGTEAGTPHMSRLLQSPPPLVVVGQARKHAAAVRGAAAAAGLSGADAQRLADALAGALALPPGDRGRPGNVLNWLTGTAKAIAGGDFTEGAAFLAGRAARQAAEATDPLRLAVDAAAQQQRLDESASQIRRAMAA